MKRYFDCALTGPQRRDQNAGQRHAPASDLPSPVVPARDQPENWLGGQDDQDLTKLDAQIKGVSGGDKLCH